MRASDYPGMQRTPCQQQQGGSGGGGNTTTTQQFKPPDFTQGPWQDYLTQAQQLTSQPYQQYQGMQVAPQSQNTDYSQGMIQDTALYGAPDTNISRAGVSQIAGGQFFNNSPWTDPSYTNSVINDTAGNMARAAAIGQNAQTDSMAALNGGYGGSAWQAQQAQNAQALDTSVGQMANQYRLQNAQMGNNNYMNGVNQMLQAANLGYQGQGLDLQAANALNSVGQQQQNYIQSLLSNDMQNYQQGQQFPYQQLQTMLQALSGASGNYGTTSVNPYAGSPSTLSQIIGLGGLGLAGYNAYNQP